MIDAFDDNEWVGSGERGNERLDFFDGAEFVVAPVHKQFGFVALVQE